MSNFNISNFRFYKSKEGCFKEYSYFTIIGNEITIISKYDKTTKSYKEYEGTLPKDSALFASARQNRQSHRYGDSYYSYNIEFTNSISIEKAVTFIQKNLDQPCKPSTDKSLGWYEDRYEIKQKDDKSFSYTRTSPYLD